MHELIFPFAEEKYAEAKNKTQPNHSQTTQPHSIGLYTEYIWGKEDSHSPCGRLAGAQPAQGSTNTAMWIMKMAPNIIFSAQSQLLSRRGLLTHGSLPVPRCPTCMSAQLESPRCQTGFL